MGLPRDCAECGAGSLAPDVRSLGSCPFTGLRSEICSALCSATRVTDISLAILSSAAAIDDPFGTDRVGVERPLCSSSMIPYVTLFCAIKCCDALSFVNVNVWIAVYCL